MTQAGAQDGEGGEEKAASLFSLVPACTRPIWFLQGWAINKKRYFTSLECISQTTLGSFGPDLYSKPHYSEDRRPSLGRFLPPGRERSSHMGQGVSWRGQAPSPLCTRPGGGEVGVVVTETPARQRGMWEARGAFVLCPAGNRRPHRTEGMAAQHDSHCLGGCSGAQEGPGPRV